MAGRIVAPRGVRVVASRQAELSDQDDGQTLGQKVDENFDQSSYCLFVIILISRFSLVSGLMTLGTLMSHKREEEKPAAAGGGGPITSVLFPLFMSLTRRCTAIRNQSSR